jgi:hypothetical protein
VQQVVVAQPVKRGRQIGQVLDLTSTLEFERIDEVEADLQAHLVAVRNGVIFGWDRVVEFVEFRHVSNHYTAVDRLAASGYCTSNLFH